MLNKHCFKWAAIAAMSTGLFCTGLPASAKTTTLVINAFLPAQDPMNTDVVIPWAEDVMKATEGRVQIKIPPTSLAAPDQLWNMVRNSVVDGAYLFNGNVASQLKLMQLPHLPFLATTAEANSIALWRTYEKFFKKADEYKNVHLLGVMVTSPGIMYSLKQPLQSMHGLDGIKVWALPGVPAKIMEMTQAGVISTPAAKMSEIIAGGAVDAYVGISDLNSDMFKVIRYVKNATVFPGGLSTPSFSLIINKRKWESIDEGDREKITALSGEAFARRIAAFDKAEKVSHAAALKMGIAYENASPKFIAEMKEGADKLEAEWIKAADAQGVDGKAALEYYREQSQSLAERK